jgi:hypothetical protein
VRYVANEGKGKHIEVFGGKCSTNDKNLKTSVKGRITLK